MRRRFFLYVLSSLMLLSACERQPGTIPVTGITLEPTSVELFDGESITVTAIVSPDDATNKQVKWTSSSPSIFVSNGTIKASFGQGASTTLINGRPALGHGTITATTDDGKKQAKCQVTVYAKTIAVIGISLSETSLQLNRGESHTLEATIQPDNASDKTIQWTSSNPSVASVDQIGNVTAIGAGKATIMASIGSVSASCSIDVNVPVTSISLDMSLLSLEVGSFAMLKATVSPDDAMDKTVQWSSDNSSVATVDQNGKVTAVSVGVAKITASAGGLSANCSVTCFAIPVESIILDKASLSLAKGATETLKATVSPSDATDKTVQWSSDNPSVVTVDRNGRVTAVNGGDATITASAGDVSASCKVNVFIPVTSVTLSLTNLTLKVGDTELLEVTVLPGDATDKNVMWSSSYPNVATVDGGRITAVGFGQTVITAQIGDQYAICTVTVLTDSPSGVTADYYGGVVSSSGDLIEPGSSLIFGVTNMSDETITVKSVQLFDEVSENGVALLPLGNDLDSGLTLKWTIDVPETGIHSPTAVFTFIYKGEEHTCSAQYHSAVIKVVRRP